MSVASCLVIFLICLSLHSCNARRLAVIDKQEKSFQISNQKEISVAGEADSCLPANKQVESAIWDDKAEEKVNKKAEKKVVKKKNDEKARKTSEDKVDEKGSSVSWVVPKPKRGAKHPAFSLDYSPPKTHPPSHN